MKRRGVAQLGGMWVQVCVRTISHDGSNAGPLRARSGRAALGIETLPVETRVNCEFPAGGDWVSRPVRTSGNGALPRWSWQSATGTGRTTVQCFRMPKNQPPMPDDPAPPTGEMVLYQTEDGRTRVECRFVDESLWLSQALIAELFQKDVRTVNEHLQNIYEEGEIEARATIRKFRISSCIFFRSELHLLAMD